MVVSRISTTSSGQASDLYKRQSSTGNGKDRSLMGDADGKEVGDSLLAAVNTVSNYVQSISREVHLYVDNTTGSQRVSVVDSTTGQTIRHIPSDEVMKLSRDISTRSSDPIKGLLVKGKA